METNTNPQEVVYNKTQHRDLYTIDPRLVDIEDGFNCRVFNSDTMSHINTLKESIRVNGLLQPISVVKYKVDGQERFKLVDGECRIRAVRALLDEGVEIPRIAAIFMSPAFNKSELHKMQLIKNGGRPFTEYEIAMWAHQRIEFWGETAAEVASHMGKKQEYVLRCLKILTFPPEIIEKIKSGELSADAARKAIANTNTEEEAIEAVDDAIETAKAEGKGKATAKHVNLEEKIENEIILVRKKLAKLYRRFVSIADDNKYGSFAEVQEILANACGIAFDKISFVEETIASAIAKKNAPEAEDVQENLGCDSPNEDVAETE